MGRSPQGDADQGAPEWTLGNDRCRWMPGAGTCQWQGNPREPWCRRTSLNQSSSSTVPVVVRTHTVLSVLFCWSTDFLKMVNTHTTNNNGRDSIFTGTHEYV